MAVAAARGVTPVGFGGFDPTAFAPGADEDRVGAVIDWLADFTSRSAKTHSGIHRDLAIRKRPTEVDAQVGIVGRLGRESGVPTPVLDRLVTLIHDVEAERRPLAPETLDALIAAL